MSGTTATSIDHNDLPDVGMPVLTLSDRSLPVSSEHGSSVASLTLPPVMTYDDGTFHHETCDDLAVDDFSERTHDQLPAVEEYKTTQGGTLDKNASSRRQKIMLATALSMVLVVIFVSIGVVIGRREARSAASNSPPKTTGTAASGTTTKTPTNRASRTDTVSAFVSTMEWSSLISTLDETSPQYKAIEWIADQDPKNIPVEDSEEFRSRYALAVFYYAMHGDYWEFKINWMTADHVCLWEADWPGESGNSFKVGVSCDDNTVTKLFLPTMNLQGTIPPEIGLLYGLRELDLYNNDVAGSMPEELRQLSALTSLILHNNVLTGHVPEWLPWLPRLQTIDLARNRLTGEIPSTIGALKELETLNLENNNLTGTLDVLENSKSIRFLALGSNQFSGGLTNELLTSWLEITDLDLSDNKLTGNLPGLLFTMEFLMVIDLHGNQFRGPLPNIVASDSAVEFLALSENKLSGLIDGRVTSLDKLRHLDLSNNMFEGDLPAEIGYLSELNYLFLAFNPKLKPGPIPMSLANLNKLVDLSLQSTNRNGTIPGELGVLENLVMLDLAGNSLNGAIPAKLGNLKQLTFLILKNNLLSGTIPSALSSLPQLNTVVIDDNNLTGGASNLCGKAGAPNILEEFIADCEEIGCSDSCCTLCCTDGNESCNNVLWYSPLDPVINYQYTRVGYKFNEKDIIYPVPGEQEDLAQYYDTFGVPP